MRARGWRATVAVGVVLLLFGCSSGESLPTPRAVAERLQCASSYEKTVVEGIPTVDVGTCRLNRETVKLLVFESTDARNAYRELMKGTGATFVEGNEFLVEVRGAATAALVEKRLS